MVANPSEPLKYRLLLIIEYFRTLLNIKFCWRDFLSRTFNNFSFFKLASFSCCTSCLKYTFSFFTEWRAHLSIRLLRSFNASPFMHINNFWRTSILLRLLNTVGLGNLLISLGAYKVLNSMKCIISRFQKNKQKII